MTIEEKIQHVNNINQEIENIDKYFQKNLTPAGKVYVLTGEIRLPDKFYAMFTEEAEKYLQNRRQLLLLEAESLLK